MRRPILWAMLASSATVLSILALVGATSTRADTHVIAQVHQPVAVFAHPGGPTLTTVGARTAFGSARVLSVLGRSGHWFRVTTADLPAGRDGWIDADAPGLTYSTTPLSITIWLGARSLELWSGTRLVRRFTVGVGAGGSPTPTGHFTVTDELAGSAYSAAYGCCILALSARQTHLPRGWSGGDRIAIHGTNVPSTIGRAASAGCIHAPDDDLRLLMRQVPLGTPVAIVA